MSGSEGNEIFSASLQDRGALIFTVQIPTLTAITEFKTYIFDRNNLIEVKIKQSYLTNIFIKS